jgi:5'-nucleotidase
MVHALNTLKIDAACFGNHEFDLLPEVTEELVGNCNFEWLLGNIKYKGSEVYLGNGNAYCVREAFGIKIGIFGIAGEDWLGILSDHYENELVYEDVGRHSQKMCKILVEEHHCDMVIALTHMRVPQDKKLPNEAPRIDIILGGHDHIVFKEIINGIPVLKDGDNFKTVGVIEVFKKGANTEAEHKCNSFDFNIRVEQIPAADDSDVDKELKMYVDVCMEEYQKNDQTVGYSAVELDTRFSQVRTRETNYGDFVADLARLHFKTDCCVINSGAIRNDALIQAGPLTYSMVANLINDSLVVIEVTGRALLEALEYGCSNLPNTFSGSFLLVSGIAFTYDYRKNPFIQSVMVGGAPLDLERKYSMTTLMYLSTGGDGFRMLKDSKYLVDPVGGIQTLALLMKFFHGAETNFGSIKRLKSKADWKVSSHSVSNGAMRKDSKDLR